MKYQMTTLEEDVQNLYTSLSIFEPDEIDMYCIADKFDIWIHYRDEKSEMKCVNGLYSIILNENKTELEQWQDFAHELGHVIKHVGKQHELRIMFRNLQECQANNFMYQFCVPTFMLLNYEISNYMNISDGVPFISKKFNVTKEFAKRRLIHFRNQCQQSISDEKHRRRIEALYPKAPPYSAETNAILNKLHKQLEKKGVTL